MGLSVEVQSRTPGQWQYWGSFFDSLLVQNIEPNGLYFKPKIYVQSTDAKAINFITDNNIKRKNAPREIPLSDKNPRWKNLLTWEIASVVDGLIFLKPLEPYLLTQGGLAREMLEFLDFKNLHLRKRCLALKERLREGQLVEDFREERRKAPFFGGGIPAPALGGLIDATNSVRIRRDRERLEYTPAVVIYTRAEGVAKAIKDQHGGSYDAVGKDTPKVGSFYGYEWFGSGTAAERVLRYARDWITLCKDQADLALKFSELQPHLDKGNHRFHLQKGALAALLDGYGGEPFNLVDLLREGFHSQMSRLNRH